MLNAIFCGVILAGLIGSVAIIGAVACHKFIDWITLDSCDE